MKIPIVLPQLGLTMTEGSVSAWLKKPGDLVGKGEMLFILATDKADMEVESLEEGQLAEVLVEPGRVVSVGTVIAYLEKPGDEIAPGGRRSDTPDVVPSEELPAARVGPAEAPAVGGIIVQPEVSARKQEALASPRARRLARKLGLDITQIRASSPSGRIVEEDVRSFAEKSPPRVVPPALRRRQLIAENTVKSIQTIPHFSVSAEVLAGEFLALREGLRRAVEKEFGIKLTLTDLLLKGLGLALAEVPEMRAVWEGGTLRPMNSIDLGLAIGAEQGVTAPVIRNVDALDLGEIARRRAEATEKARHGRLSVTDLEGGIGTLSNLGMYRVDHFQAIIIPGQSFILAVGRVEKRPCVNEGALTVAPTVVLNLSVDHRMADGALAAQFLSKIAENIENPYRLVGGSAKSGLAQ